jgi:ribose/xylose/arabinose/galactoside ABC-type transport system permease subunit
MGFCAVVVMALLSWVSVTSLGGPSTPSAPRVGIKVTRVTVKTHRYCGGLAWIKGADLVHHGIGERWALGASAPPMPWAMV